MPLTVRQKALTHLMMTGTIKTLEEAEGGTAYMDSILHEMRQIRQDFQDSIPLVEQDIVLRILQDIIRRAS
jgi:hypothetical protein